jgi:hypothetical protein
MSANDPKRKSLPCLDIRNGAVLYSTMGDRDLPTRRKAEASRSTPVREGTHHGRAEYNFNRQTGPTYWHT